MIVDDGDDAVLVAFVLDYNCRLWSPLPSVLGGRYPDDALPSGGGEPGDGSATATSRKYSYARAKHECGQGRRQSAKRVSASFTKASSQLLKPRRDGPIP